MKKSNITVCSNIYPLKGSMFADQEFLRHVEGMKALKILDKHSDYRKGRDFSTEQNFQWSYGLKCERNEEGDYTWGLILKDGKLQKACRCMKKSCSNFKICRSDFTENVLQYHSFNEREKSNEVNTNLNEIDLPEPQSYDDKNVIDENIKCKYNLVNDINLEKCRDYKDLTGVMVSNGNATNINELNLRVNSEKTDLDRIEGNEKKIITIDSNNLAKSDNRRIKQNIVDQQYVIEASKNTKLLVNAGPGTGKTYTLIERLKYLTDNDDIIPAQEMLVLCFSKAAIAEIKNRIEQAIQEGTTNDDLRFLDIRTFDSFATYFIAQLNGGVDLSELSYEERIKMATDLIERQSNIFDNIKHFIVDEIQDLVGVRAKLVQTILKALKSGFTLLGDSCQSIYDYQIEDKDTEIDSVKFYKWLKDYFGEGIVQVEFEGNLRQTEILHNLVTEIRESILLKDSSDLKAKKIGKVLKRVDSIGKCSKLTPEMVDRATTTCFLCRNNGEVLKLSQQLRDQGILHSIQKSSTSRLIEPWLGAVLGEHDRDTIDFLEFAELYKNAFQEADPNNIQAKWEVLRNLDRDKKSRLNAKKIIENIHMENSSIKDLYVTDKSNVIVSTIHRAKGREFEQVILLLNSFTRFLNKAVENIDEEVKNFYVAVTRPKKDIKIIEFNREACLRTIKDKEKRWVETIKYPNQTWNRIIGIEIGTGKDINILSFIDLKILKDDKNVKDNQNYIRNQIRKGDEVILKMVNIVDNLQDTIYYIYHENQLIGSMSKNFTYQLINALTQIQNWFKKLPLEIHGVYVDEIVTYISRNIGGEVPLIYKKTNVWNGVYLVGFGKLKWNEL